MQEKFLRVYKKFDIHEVKEHLLIYGDLSAQCANCQTLDIKLEAPECPECHNTFTYIAFRNVKTNLPKLQRIVSERADLQIIDHDDFKRSLAEAKAKEFLQ